MVCTTVTFGQGATKCKCISVVEVRGGDGVLLAYVGGSFLAKIDTVILTDDSTEYLLMTPPNNHQ